MTHDALFTFENGESIKIPLKNLTGNLTTNDKDKLCYEIEGSTTFRKVKFSPANNAFQILDLMIAIGQTDIHSISLERIMQKQNKEKYDTSQKKEKKVFK